MKNNVLKYVLCVFLGVCVGVGGFFAYDKFFNSDEEKTNDVDKETIEKVNDLTNEIIEKNNITVIEYDSIPEKCKSTEEKLVFTNVTNYCYRDICTEDYNYILKYSSSFTSTSDAIYSFNLDNGKIVVIKNDDTNNKYYINDIDNVKIFRVEFTVQGSTGDLFVLDNNNDLYLYEIDSNYKNVTNKRLIYKNVKEFDTFEGNDYKECVGESEGQNVQIAIHTNNGKFVYSSPYDLKAE